MSGGAERNGNNYFQPSNLQEYKAAQEQVPRLELTPEEEEFGLAVHDLFLRKYKQAEKSRRWSLHDIDWDLVSKQPLPPNLALTIETFKNVEDFIQDFTESGLTMYRRNLGLSEGHISWGGEELRHGVYLGEVLVASGARTPEEVAQTRSRMFNKQWTPTYNTPRETVIYAANQELVTRNFYKELANLLEEAGATEAARGTRLVQRDEGDHHDYYKKITQMYGDRDPRGTAADVLHVHDTFVMPAQLLLANSGKEYALRIGTMRKLGIFTPEKQQRALDDTIHSLGYKSREDLVSTAA